MKVKITRTNGEIITYNRAYDVYERGMFGEFIVIVYPDELDHNVEAEMEYREETIDHIEITPDYKGE